MSEKRKECYECKYKDRCYEMAAYDSMYCKSNRNYEEDKNK